MSTKNEAKTVPPNAPLSSEPHGISCTIVDPTPPTSPNQQSNFATSQTKLTKSKLSADSKKAKKGS